MEAHRGPAPLRCPDRFRANPCWLPVLINASRVQWRHRALHDCCLLPLTLFVTRLSRWQTRQARPGIGHCASSLRARHRLRSPGLIPQKGRWRLPEPLVGSGIDVAAAWERACADGSGHCPTLGARLVPRRPWCPAGRIEMTLRLVTIAALVVALLSAPVGASVWRGRPMEELRDRAHVPGLVCPRGRRRPRRRRTLDHHRSGRSTRAARAVHPRAQGDGDPLGRVVRHPRPEWPMTFDVVPPIGSLQREWRRCGKPRCRCARGSRHGPYWYLRWREGGRQRRRYVARERVDATRAALEQQRRLRPPAWSLRQRLAELRQLAKEVHDAGQD